MEGEKGIEKYRKEKRKKQVDGGEKVKRIGRRKREETSGWGRKDSENWRERKEKKEVKGETGK